MPSPTALISSACSRLCGHHRSWCGNSCVRLASWSPQRLTVLTVACWAVLIGALCVPAWSHLWLTQPLLCCAWLALCAPVTVLLAAILTILTQPLGPRVLSHELTRCIVQSGDAELYMQAWKNEAAHTFTVDVGERGCGASGEWNSASPNPNQGSVGLFASPRKCGSSRHRAVQWQLRVLVLCVAAYCGSLYYCLHYRGLWCSYPNAVHVELCDTAVHVSSVLTSAGIKHWMSRGDLVALAREADVMAWEHDLDMCVLSTRMEDAEKALRHASIQAGGNFTVHALGNVLPGSPVLYVPIPSLTRSNPFYTMNSPTDVFAVRDGEPLVVDLYPCADSFPTPDDAVFDTEQRPYCNIIPGRDQHLPFPEQRVLTQMLQHKYGQGWRRPVFDHHWALCSIHVDARS